MRHQPAKCSRDLKTGLQLNGLHPGRTPSSQASLPHPYKVDLVRKWIELQWSFNQTISNNQQLSPEKKKYMCNHLFPQTRHVLPAKNDVWPKIFRGCRQWSFLACRLPARSLLSYCCRFCLAIFQSFNRVSGHLERFLAAKARHRLAAEFLVSSHAMTGKYGKWYNTGWHAKATWQWTSETGMHECILRTIWFYLHHGPTIDIVNFSWLTLT